jgi:uncharacterized membrane protein
LPPIPVICLAASASALSASPVAAGPSPAGFGVVAAALAAAVLHAIWNAMAHAISDRLIGFALIGVAYLGVSAVVVAFTGPPPAEAWVFIIASAVVHVAYQLLLLASYQLGEFSQVYPLARGTSPWVVALISVTVLGSDLPTLELAGVLVVSAGLIGLVFVGGRPTRTQLPALAAAFATGLMIATYTVIAGSASPTPPSRPTPAGCSCSRVRRCPYSPSYAEAATCPGSSAASSASASPVASSRWPPTVSCSGPRPAAHWPSSQHSARPASSSARSWAPRSSENASAEDEPSPPLSSWSASFCSPCPDAVRI